MCLQSYATGISGMSANICMWVVIQLLLKCCWMWKYEAETLIAFRFALLRDTCIVIAWSLWCGGRWKYLDIALQAGGNLRMWNVCWSSNEFVTLSGHIIVMANPCVVGVEIKIHRLDVITMGGNVDGVWSIGMEHCALSCRIAHLHQDILNTVYLWSNHLCFIICNSYIFVIDFVFHWYIPCWAGRLKISYILSCCVLSCMGTSMSCRNCSAATSTCVFRYW